MKSESIIRTLSESEIQKRLYGVAQGQTSRPVRMPAHPLGTAEDSSWTGSEILMGEVQRLRLELVAIRQEKVRLAEQIEHVQRLPEPLGSSEDIRPGTGIWGRLLGLALLLGMTTYLMGGHLLQASPSGAETTPFTVQVAVYDVQRMAQQAGGFLGNLGYKAFVVQTTRRNGLPRYQVCVGSFVTKEESAQELQRLAADPRFQDFKDAFVRIR